MEPSAEIAAITERMWVAFFRGDADAVVARLSGDGHLSFVGTDPREELFDHAAVASYHRTQFEAYPQGISLDGTVAPPDVSIHAWSEGTVGWSLLLSEAVSSVTGESRRIRCSQVFHLERDEWKMVHRHWSFGVSNDEMWPEVPFEEFIAGLAGTRADLSGTSAPDGTVTVVFTDIENSTRLNVLAGDLAWLEVLRAHNEIIAGVTNEHGGSVVKNVGDGFMLAFPSARRGAHAAIAMQRRVGEVFNDPGSPIRIRIGVHIGEVLSDSDDLFGTAVNYAARVAASAKGGEILVSDLVRGLLESTGEFSFDLARDAVFKGIESPQAVNPLVWREP